MSDLNAAIGISQLKRFTDLSKKRKELARYYDKKFSKFKNYLTIFKRDYANEVPHIYCLIIKNLKNRELIRKKLLKNNIETGVHYKPGYLLDFYKSNKKHFPNCESIHQKVLTLPLHPGISKKNIDKIVRILIGMITLKN